MRIYSHEVIHMWLKCSSQCQTDNYLFKGIKCRGRTSGRQAVPLAVGPGGETACEFTGVKVPSLWEVGVAKLCGRGQAVRARPVISQAATATLRAAYSLPTQLPSALVRERECNTF